MHVGLDWQGGRHSPILHQQMYLRHWALLLTFLRTLRKIDHHRKDFRAFANIPIRHDGCPYTVNLSRGGFRYLSGISGVRRVSAQCHTSRRLI